jgi:4-amino-4-deoxy-L-arabinose transferase-like glycosyltransferase
VRDLSGALARLVAPPALPWLLLAVATPVVFLIGAGERAVYGTAAFYAAVSRQIAETGVWSPLFHGDVPYVLKPPLQFWLTALNVHLLGPTNLAATLWPRLFAVGCVALVADIGRRSYGPAAGFCAGLMTLANVTLIENATTFRHESALLFGMLLSLWAYLAPRGAWRPALFYAGVVLAVLAKGPPGLVPLALAPLHAWWSGRLSAPWRAPVRGWLAGSVLLLLPGLWYAEQYRQLGSPMVDQLVTDAALDWAGPADRAREMLGRYLLRPFLRWLPFSLFMVWGVTRAARAGLRGRAGSPAAALDRTLLVWILLILVVLAFRTTHRVRYALMVLPPLALLGGSALARLVGDRLPTAWLRQAALALVLALAVLATWRPAFDRSDGMRGVEIMRRLLGESLGDASTPVPVLLPEGVQLGPYGGQEATRDWVYYYLGRRVRPVWPADLEGAEPGSLYVVYDDSIDALRPNLPVRVVVETKRSYLVEWLPRARPGPDAPARP